jgi:hypothetical protein
MKAKLKLVAYNLLVFLAILYVLNIFVIIFFAARNFYLQSKQEKSDARAKLPNYKNIEWASEHFVELARTKSAYRSYVGWRRLPFVGKTISVDSSGLRKTEQTVKNDTTLKSILFLGGSTMWGTGVNDSGTIPSLFIKKIPVKANYRAYNLGESGYRAYQSYLFLNHIIMTGITPSVVISYDGVNEVFGLKKDNDAFSDAKEETVQRIVKDADSERVYGYSLWTFLTGPLKELAQYLRDRNANVQDGLFYDTTAYRAKKVAFFLLESWLRTKWLCDKYDARFVCVLQPNAGVGKPRKDHLILNAEVAVFAPFYSKVKELLYTDPRYKELLPCFLDLSELFNSRQYIYIDYCHVSPNGNQLVAQKIADFLKK